jgi:hypothetical protein
MMSLGDIFVGAPQSKLAGIFILLTIAFVAVYILAGKEKIAFSQKIAVVLLLVLLSLPTILLTLFQITCVVTGAGFRDAKTGIHSKWWCNIYAWIVSVILIAYCIMLVVVATMSFATSRSIIADVEGYSAKAANMATAEYFETMEEAAKKMREAVAPMLKGAAGPEAPMAPPPAGPAGPEAMTMPKKEPFTNYAMGPKEKFVNAKKEAFAEHGPKERFMNAKKEPFAAEEEEPEGFVNGGFAAF